MRALNSPSGRFGLATVAFAALAASSAASAHEATAADPWAWSFEPWAIALLAVAALVYAAGARRLAARSTADAARRRSALLWWSGLGLLALALTSPLHAAGARSFAAHMLEHELLMLVAAPLMVLSRPGGVLLWGLPAPLRAGVATGLQGDRFRGGWRTLSAPMPATALQLVALFGWHAPAAFGLALASEGWHALQHACFLGTALLFWNAMFARPAAARMPAVVGCLFVTSILGGALGAFMALSSSPWYAAYRAMQLSAFGLTPVQDQQLAGLLMWMPGGLVHAAAGLALLARGLRGAPPTLVGGST